MDLRRLRAGEWWLAVGAVAAVIAPFLPWYEGRAGLELTGWEALSRVDILLFAAGVLALGVVILTAQQGTSAAPIAAQALFTLFAVVVCVAVVARFLRVPDDLTREAGAWVGLVSAPLLVAAALLAMRDERLSGHSGLTDQTGVPVDAPPQIETIPTPRGR